MRPEVTTDAIVVKSIDYREVDRLYTLFTAESGMVTAHGTSARKPLSKLAGHLAVPGVVRAFLVKGRQFERLAGAQLIEQFDGFAESSDGMQTYGALRRLLAIAHPEPRQDLPVFEAFVLVCRQLQRPEVLASAAQRALWVHLFALRLLAHSGYHPMIEACVRCGERNKPFIAFSVDASGVVCASCRPFLPKARPVSDHVLNLLQRVLLHHNESEQRIALPTSDVAEFVRLVQALLQYHFAPSPPIFSEKIELGR